ncbi:hypothetical protein [Aliiroseovarius subalbicans]|uniref:hypothetical protein n=1 Tax=Aliiroseovarius subalbicans TaxID=2925840 RepID=UPI001F567CDE|nr:hypothetical protein [Aliiroseovarius subalbicans]MCI2400780.1 hypothetical protein [Aliiroseovarius subalbicans]
MRITAILLTLLLATPVQAGVYQTPAGGWGVDDPVSPPPRPRPRGFSSAAGGSPNI